MYENITPFDFICDNIDVVKFEGNDKAYVELDRLMELLAEYSQPVTEG